MNLKLASNFIVLHEKYCETNTNIREEMNSDYFAIFLL